MKLSIMSFDASELIQDGTFSAKHHAMKPITSPIALKHPFNNAGTGKKII
ncbi:MAG: hypothetical protein ACXW04_04930 [Methylobacter sp.]